MNPPPSTPTPRRFLLPKRSSQLSQTPTVPPRFQSTPRFGSSSVPRPTQSRELDIDDEEEEEEDGDDGSHCSSQSDEEEAPDRRKHDAIDIQSDDDVTASQEAAVSPGRDSEPEAHESMDIVSSSPSDSSHGSPLEREAKRRRVSISPAPILDSPRDQDVNIPTSQDANSASIEEDGASEIRSDSEQSLQDAPDTRTPQQPVFQPAPRFKPIQVDDAFEGLPAAFSPQRRGEKYIGGGLAAELQGWLSEVKGWEVADGEADSLLKIDVDEVRPGKRMCLINTATTGLDEKSKRWILAGEGKLTGLGRRAEVRLGSVVTVGQPVWDVELDGDTWTVACDWSVESL